MAELPQFVKEAIRILGDIQHERLIEFLAFNPTAGVVVPDTGGIRKLRWSVAGRGKRGGARVIYYFHNDAVPILALDIYAKNEAENISPAQKKALRKIVAAVVKNTGDRYEAIEESKSY